MCNNYHEDQLCIVVDMRVSLSRSAGLSVSPSVHLTSHPFDVGEEASTHPIRKGRHSPSRFPSFSLRESSSAGTGSPGAPVCASCASDRLPCFRNRARAVPQGYLYLHSIIRLGDQSVLFARHRGNYPAESAESADYRSVFTRGTVARRFRRLGNLQCHRIVTYIGTVLITY